MPGAWATTVGRLAPDGLLVDGTCDELGRLATWVAVTADGPVSLSLSWRLRGLERPAVVAERLPKVLIHRNVPGEGVHRLLADLDEAWARQAPQAAYGVRQRFLATAGAVRDAGWPVLDGPSRWRLGELTFAWDAVAPGAPSAAPGCGSLRCGSPGAVGALVALAAAHHLVQGRLDVGEVDPGGDDRDDGEEADPAEGDDAQQRGDAGDEQPELLGALAGRGERVGRGGAGSRRARRARRRGPRRTGRGRSSAGAARATTWDQRRRQTSRRIVTGPSLTSSTSMWAPNRPVCTSTPRARRAATTCSTTGSATGPGAAAFHEGRRPLRVSA